MKMQIRYDSGTVIEVETESGDELIENLSNREVAKVSFTILDGARLLLYSGGTFVIITKNEVFP